MSGEIQKQFLLTSKIGNGNFSTVYLAKHIKTQQIVAVKTMKNHIPIAYKEAQILKKMNHPNIIKLFKFQKPKNKDQALIVLQYVPQNILELYEAQEYGLKQEQVKCILFQSCLGLYHIHKKGIIHRDIKPQNIMINRNKAQVKLIDFGLAIEQEKCITDYVATRWYRAPENLLGTKQYTVAIDIFSLGCVIVQIYSGNPLFPGANNIDQISKILTVIGEPTIQSWRKGYEMFVKFGLSFQIKKQKKKITLRNLLTSCSQGLIKLIEKMLILNPTKRITSEQILKDPYFNDIQKIIPPHVYDQYLIDIKNNFPKNQKDQSKIQPSKNKKQRMRFMSQQKGFGAFTSFKSTLPNKLQNGLKKTLNKTNTNEQTESKKKISLEGKIISKNHESMSTLNRIKSPEKGVYSNGLKVSETAKDLNSSRQNNIANISTDIKKSIENYEKNLIKLSSSLRTIKQISKQASKQVSEQVRKNPDKKFQNTTQEFHLNFEVTNRTINQKPSETLSFRGFNQPKQNKPPIKQNNENSTKKNSTQEEKLFYFPIKSKKVIEHLQRFQNRANQNQEQQQNPKLQNSKSELVITQNINKTPKKIEHNDSKGKKPSFLKQTSRNFQKQLKSAQSSNQILIKQHQNSFHIEQISSKIKLPLTYRKQQKILHKQSRDFQTQVLASEKKIKIASPVAIKSYHAQKTKFVSYQSPPKDSKQIQMSKINSARKEPSETQNSYFIGRSSIQGSRSILFSEKSSFISPEKINQVFLGESSSKQFYITSPMNNSAGFSKTNSINISSSRPIQKKIKLLAGRDSLPNNALPSNHRAQQLLNSSQSTVTLVRNPTLYEKPSTFQKNFSFISKGYNTISTNSFRSYDTLQSPRRQANNLQGKFNVYSSQKQTRLHPSESYPQQMKYIQSIEHRQLLGKKQPQKQSIKEQLYKIKENEYYEEIIKNQGKLSQKNHQTTLSQLRQSITGLTQSIQEGAYHSQRTQKMRNKNIKINLNLNIQSKNSPRKR